MKVECEVTNATIVTPQGRFRGTIAVNHGRVAGILAEPHGKATRTVDAEGLFALPGMVDQHVHFMDPGDTEREDFIHGSSAAAVGGGYHRDRAYAQQPRAHYRRLSGESNALE